MPIASYTEVSAFRTCQKRWEYRYKIGLKRKRKHIRLLRGEILHEMLDAYIQAKLVKGYTGDDPWDVLDKYAQQYANYFEEEKEHYGDIVGDCGEIFEGYLRKYRKDPLTYEGSEIAVYFDLPGVNVRFAGFIDKVAHDAQGRRWLVDHKFVATIPSAEDRFSELQFLLYVWAWEQVFPDTPIDGILWDYGRAKAPTKPELLKNGKQLSQRKNIDCDVHTYRKTILAHGFSVKEYSEMLKHLEGKENTFFERVRLPRPTDIMIKMVTDDFLQSVDEIKIKKGKGKASRCVRSMSPFNCNTCEFRPLCEAEVRGHDAKFIRKSEYDEREIGDD